MTKPHIMRLGFDVGQLTQALSYDFLKPNGKLQGIVGYGKEAGSYQFELNKPVQLEVQATYDPTPNQTPVNLELLSLNCAFVFAARNGLDDPNPPLSPFSLSTASFNIGTGDWDLNNEPFKPIPNKDVSAVSATSKNIFEATSQGQWAMSGFLSVSYSLQPDNPGEMGIIRSRFFSFDPELSAGSGGLGG